jgi:hypothetical protein
VLPLRRERKSRSRDRGAAWGFRGLGRRMQRGRPELRRDNQCQYQRVRDLPPFCCPSGFPARCRGAAARGAVAAFGGADRILRSSGQRRRTARAGLRGWLEAESRRRSGPLRLDSEVMRVDVC